MKPLVITMAMAVVAFATSAAAWYFYPRIEVRQEVARQQLLTEEEAFQPVDVRKIKIEQFDRARNGPVEFEFRLESGSWVIPSRANYPANDTVRVAVAVNAMRDKEILEMVSDSKDDHEEYGVLEMSELGSTGLGAGTVLTFEGRNRKRLGKLIVGTSPEGKANQRYVRLAGQPQIYIVEFDGSILTTDFSDWVDGSLIRVGANQTNSGELIQHIDVDLYFLDQGGDAEKKTSYRARISRTADNRWVYDLWKPDQDQNLPDEPTLANQDVNLQPTLTQFVGQVMRFSIRDVARKQESAALDLASPKESQPATHFDSLKTRGFYHTGFEKGQHQFASAAGEINIAYRNGMEVKIHIGSLAGVDVAGGGILNRFMMLTADVDPSLVPEPQKPDLESGVEASGDEAAEPPAQQESESGDDEQRRYQVELKRRSGYLAAAERESRSFNQVHADWIYVVPEDVIARLFPPAEAWKKTENQ